MTHHGAAALSGAEPTVGLPLEIDRVRPAIALDRATVIGAERLGEGHADVLVVAAGEHPALLLEPRDELGGSASSTVGESDTAVAPPAAGAVRHANSIRPGTSSG